MKYREGEHMILDQIVEATKIRVAKEKCEIPLNEYIEIAMKKKAQTEEFRMEKALKKPGIHFICEVKKASPSKGIIAKEFDYLTIAKEYEMAGASAISVLTEPDFFCGDLKYLEEISKEVTIPLLRKDFIIDEYQIYQAKAKGASCVLLICAILSFNQLKEYLSICNELGLSALVEIHDEEEATRAIEAGARIIGVNNRNLKDFTVDLNNSLKLRERIPLDILFIGESGIKTSSDIKKLYDAKVNAVLIGETMMRSPNKKQMLVELKSEVIG